MTSSLRPLIAVFILPEKIKVFQHGGDRERYRRQAPKNAHNFLITVRKISPACDLVAKMLLILKKHYFRPDYSRQNLRYDRPKKCPTICMGSICGWNLQPRWGCSATLNTATAFSWLPNFRCDIGLYLGCSGAGIISSTMLYLLGFIYCVNYLHHIKIYLPSPLYDTKHWAH